MARRRHGLARRSGACRAPGSGTHPAPRSPRSRSRIASGIERWWRQGIQGNHHPRRPGAQPRLTGSYSSVRRFLAGLEAAHPQVTTVLEFEPGEAAQVDFGKGPEVVRPTHRRAAGHLDLRHDAGVVASRLRRGRHRPEGRHLAGMSPPGVRVVQRRAAAPDHRQSQVCDHPRLLPRPRGAAWPTRSAPRVTDSRSSPARCATRRRRAGWNRR